jgi:diaminohydroxyphosphoribosylaminopyrimidine deaminase/5-amino-6-(5-phosphoribosylamino)uracil reductase
MLPLEAGDHKFMRAALAEARKGVGHTSPNPAVGAVIVKNGRILARGHHHAAGQPHAEIEAIRAAKNPARLRGATIYVTLEPCSTHGRTPPCTEAILRHGFARVVFGATDPNPAHAGRAERLLREAGVAVASGVLADECAALNVAWNHWIVTRRPWVIAKCGMSLDGRIGSHPESRWITSETSRAHAMRVRAEVDAILVGGGTVRADDPQLTVRGIPSARQPWRVVWSQGGDLPATARLFTDEHRGRTLTFVGQSLADVLAELGRREITSVLIEGGGHTLGEAFDARLVNRVLFYMAPQILGGPVSAVGGEGVASAAAAPRLKNVDYRRLGPDVLIAGDVDFESVKSTRRNVGVRKETA